MSFGASQLTSMGGLDIAIARFNDFDDLRTTIPELCVVVVDPASSKNKIVWDKPASSKITEYNVYRENPAGEMKKIGSVAYSGNNYFIDNASAPLQQAYLYSISLTDVCGNESQINNYEHKTMHLQMYPGPNNVWSLLWSTYWGVNVNYYRIKRGTSATNLIPLDSISGNTGEILTYTDLNPPAGTVYYSIEAVTEADCDGLSSSNPSSNKVSYVASTTDVADALNSAMTLYPNPNNGQFTIEWNNFNAESYAVKVMNMEGVVVYQSSALNASSVNEFDLSAFAKGLYTLEIEVNGSKLFKKVSVQ
jgi:hypothetical protein